MGIDFSKLQADFKEYLLQNGDITQEEFDERIGSVSIFSYMNEFKDYLKSEYDCSDVSIFSMSVSDILKMDVQNGKLIDPNAKSDDSNDFDNGKSSESIDEQGIAEGNIESTQNPPGEIGTEQTEGSGNMEVQEIPVSEEGTEDAANAANLENTNLITNILNDLMKDDTFKSAIDINTDGDISEDELGNFLDIIKDYDNDASNISLEDLMAAIKDIQEGKFNPVEETEEEPEEEQEIEEVEQTKNTPRTSNANNAARSSGGSSGTGSASGASSMPKTVEKTLDNMNKEELNEELNTAQTDLSEKQDALSAILDGSDPEISGLKETMDDAFETYQKELEKVDKNMADDLQELKDKIDAKQKEIDEKEQEISDQECAVSEAETAYDNAVSSRDNLKEIVSNLENTDTSEMNSEQASNINTKLQDARSRLETAEAAVTEAEEARDDAKEKLEELKEEKEALISGEGEDTLNPLNEKMQEMETQILDKYPEIKDSMDAYKEAKDNYDSTKTARTEDAKSSIEKSQAYVNDVQTAITNYDNKQTARELSPASDMQAAVDWARQFDDYSQEEMRQIFAELGHQFDYNAWCADFVKMALYEGVGEENLPEWYRNVDNKAYCPTIQAHGEGHQISAEEAQTGDIVLYDWDGDGSADHVGLFVDNGDGSSTITAIEGNTSGAGGGSCVEEKARERNTILGIYSMHE